MNKHECLAAVTKMCSLWNKELDTSSLTKRAEGFYPFFKDLDYDAVMDVVEEQALGLKQWMPRPAELRVDVLSREKSEEMPPTSNQAWVQLQHIQRQVEIGTYDYPKAHPVLKATLQRLGNEAALNLTTNGDRKLFEEIYNKEREKYIHLNYGLV